MIEFEYEIDVTRVKRDGKVIGEIKPVERGFAYFPKGSREHGEILGSIQQVQKQVQDLHK